MSELIGKLTNLGYEFFGVIVPGFFCLLLLIAWWWALGSIPDQITSGLPTLNYPELKKHDFNATDGALLIALIYFLGHLLNWLSRHCGHETQSAIKRVGMSLIFRIPRPKASFDGELNDLMEASAIKMGIPIDEHTWRRFYPIAKIMLAERLNRSLVSTYQNKYTLHRCVTAAAALLFWLSVITILGCGYCRCTSVQLSPRWIAVFLCALGALTIVWGFSSSFAYHWKMFGNTVVTESFCLLSGWTESAKKTKTEQKASD